MDEQEIRKIPWLDGVKKIGVRRHSMRWRMIGILLICWMIPFAFMIGILGVYLAGNHGDMTAENFCDQLAFNNRICVERLNGAVAASRQASYDGTLLTANEEYRAGRLSYVKAEHEYREYLTAQYQKNDALSSVILWFCGENPDADTVDTGCDGSKKISVDGVDTYSVYNERANGSFLQTRSFLENDYVAVEEQARKLGTGIRFLKRGRNLYLLRNLMDSHYQRRGTLVFCLNRAYCFDSLSEYPLADGLYAVVDSGMTGAQVEIGAGATEETDAGAQAESGAGAGQEQASGKKRMTGVLELQANDRLLEWMRDREDGYEWLGERLCVCGSQQGDAYKLRTAMMLQKEVTKYPFYGYPYVLAAMVLSLIPMLQLMVHVFRTKVTDPVEVLSEGARHIEKGELGYQIEEPVGSLELTYLRDSFNQMSAHLKQQFDRIYQEEIALREARIMALQSQINPHFMNNTLEIINWEARLGGNERVSKMIGALSTMLDAALDRHSRPLVKLSEEMVYVNAYLYITKERLGKKLTVEQELPEELMDCLVPRLILQPVIENAIEHGVVPNRSGTVGLRCREDGQYLYLEVTNNGGLSEEDRARTDRLLAPDYVPGTESAGNLGIANVNQRLRILCGEPCGLTITEREPGLVVARLMMSLQR